MRSHSRFATQQSRKFVERKKKRVVTVSALVIISLFSWIFAFSRFSSLEMFSIDNISVEGIGGITASNLQSAAFNALDGNYLGILSRSNILLYPHDRMVAAILQSSPNLQSVTIGRDGFHKLDIAVKEKTPTAVVCADLPDFSSNNIVLDDLSSCYFADSTGYLFKKVLDTSLVSFEFSSTSSLVASSSSSSSIKSHELLQPTQLLQSIEKMNRYYVPSLTDSVSSTTSIVGMYATSTKLFNSLQDFYKKVGESDIKAVAMLMKDDGEYELYAENHNTSNGTMVIYFRGPEPFTDEFDNLNVFYKHALNENSNGKNETDFEYIDVRYSPNVFFRKIK